VSVAVHGEETLALPHDLSAERAVLGTILVRQDAYPEVCDVLQQDDFFRYAHQLVYGMMGTLHQQGEAIDFITIKNGLDRSGSLDEVGIAYLSGLVDGIPRSTDCTQLARVVGDYADRRRIIDVCQHAIAESANAITAEVAATSVVDSIRAAVRLRGEEGTTLGASLTELIASLDNPVPAVTTGIPSLDALGCGHRAGELTLLAGRPSHGKTAFALHMARAAALSGVRVWFASLEMTREALSMRWLASDSGVSFSALRSSTLAKAQYKQISDSLARLTDLPITIDDHAGIGLSDLRRAVVGTKSLLFVDYLQLVTPPRASKNTSRVHEVGAISRGLKAIAHDCKVPVVALCQLNRQAELQQHPSLSQLRDSGELEQDADRVFLISRPCLNDEQELPDRCLLRVAKHRNGPLGKIELVFDGTDQSFRERTHLDSQPLSESSDATKMKRWH
jgi:replicative DNA helicase